MTKPCPQNWHRLWYPKRKHNLALGCKSVLSNLIHVLAIKIGTAVIARTRLRCNGHLAKACKSESLGLPRSMYAQTHEIGPLCRCVSDGLVHRSFLSRIGRARIACSDAPPTRQNLVLNARASQIFRVRYTGATAGPRGLGLERCSSGRPRLRPARSASRVQSSMCLRTFSRVRLNAARERTACACIQAVARARASSENVMRKCAPAPAREFSVALA